jgi:hypothetical protein
VRLADVRDGPIGKVPEAVVEAADSLDIGVVEHLRSPFVVGCAIAAGRENSRPAVFSGQA